jgi:hypothetical protein
VGGHDSTIEMHLCCKDGSTQCAYDVQAAHSLRLGHKYIRTPSELLGAVGQPLPGPVSSVRPCASLRLRAPAIGISQLWSRFVAVAPHTHASARWLRRSDGASAAR